MKNINWELLIGLGFVGMSFVTAIAVIFGFISVFSVFLGNLL